MIRILLLLLYTFSSPIFLFFLLRRSIKSPSSIIHELPYIFSHINTISDSFNGFHSHYNFSFIYNQSENIYIIYVK